MDQRQDIKAIKEGIPYPWINGKIKAIKEGKDDNVRSHLLFQLSGIDRRKRQLEGFQCGDLGRRDVA